MARTLTLTADDAAAVNRAISITRDEPYLVVVGNKPDAALTMTIASEAGSAPLIEIPGTGQIELPPAAVQTLIEGRSYQYNIWQIDGPMVLFSGVLLIGNSIAPTGADFSTTFLNGVGVSGAVTTFVQLSQAQYDALPQKDALTLYLIG